MNSVRARVGRIGSFASARAGRAPGNARLAALRSRTSRGVRVTRLYSLHNAVSSPDGEVYFNSPGVATVAWDHERATVFVEWEGWADSAEFAALLDAGVLALRKHRGSRWLADCRRQRVLNPTDTERADREWLPRAVAAGLRRFAVVLPASGLAAMDIKEREATLSAVLQVGYFASVDDTREWLAT